MCCRNSYSPMAIEVHLTLLFIQQFSAVFSNDEFYDAKEWLSEEDSDADASDRASDKLTDKSEKVSSKTAQPKGRLASLAPLCLLNEPDVTMYEPITQVQFAGGFNDSQR